MLWKSAHLKWAFLHIIHIYKKRASSCNEARRNVTYYFSTRLEIGHIYCAIIETTIFDQFLAVPSHDSLGGGITVRVEYCRSAEQRDIRGVEVTGVQNARSLEAQENLAIREERVLVQPQLALDRSGVHDADVHTLLDKSV